MKFQLKIINSLLITILTLTSSLELMSQGLSPELKIKVEKKRAARIMFYNCENLFDYLDDSLINDEEFLPKGSRYWTKTKYFDKLNHISRVITAIGGWSAPELVGLCEIENAKTLYDLTHNTPLYTQEYKIIHKESPDKRGIDVALLFQPKSYSPIQNKFIELHFPNQPEKRTRDILYSYGILNQSDTLHIFVNHWPSRWGGELESAPYRIFVATALKKQTDSIFMINPNANILIMGDFNDEPTNNSLTKGLNTENSINNLKSNNLYNLTAIASSTQQTGTHKYRGTWSFLDQFILSGKLLNENSQLHTSSRDFCIFNAPFLLEKDESYLGDKPYRTFIGYKYNGGYSDHLPIFFDLNNAKN